MSIRIVRKSEVRILAQRGLSYREIARRTGVSHQRVSQILRPWVQHQKFITQHNLTNV